ncbi:Guanine deaminase [Sulfitobacter noctilucicola]|uniref:Guanine deaminase n=1 Tax=Sulfitobacter noctilucicola TaxID=1342301 RepID=A0A7W6MA76_9RHOB|nr:guanine deaminase [Sulfitobacter noctilucicola]KIN64324.1 Guanine deaminase [Sulfitobacter noctilucicola]MBB4174512.1 guanine deaminase [Sulfitobacter noctilucicola]
MMDTTLLVGPVLRFDGNPMDGSWQDAVRIDTAGAVLVCDGVIKVVGSRDTLLQDHPQAARIEYADDHLICPGFVDAHVHYPQTGIIASWGKRLIDWLNEYTFPEEMRLSDPAYAQAVAARYLDLTRAHGTTTVASYCTIHAHSVDALFTAAAERNQRVVAGKTCMDRNAPEGLCDTAQSAYDDSKTLIERWHDNGRASYAITPRFTPTSTNDQLAALGALWAEHPDCLMQTHLSEQVDEIAWVRALRPETRDYLDTYEAHGLIGERAVFGHAIHLEPREIDRIAETGAALIHCPTSNTFIGSGLFDMAGLAARHLPVGLATDTGGGSSFSMLRTMAAAYEIGQLRGTPLHAAELIWLATAGSARTLHLADKIGSISIGYEADITVLDLSSTPAIAQRHAQAKDMWESLFATIMMGDDRAIADVWIAGIKSVAA